MRQDLFLTVDPKDPTKAHGCVEGLCMMVINITPPRSFTVSFDPDIALLVEKGQVNMIKDGKGTPIAFYDLYEDKDLDAVIDRDGKRYTVRFHTWSPDKNLEAPKVTFHFEVEVEPIPEPTAEPAA